MTPFARSLTAAAMGAAAMYWLDPRGSRRRRASNKVLAERARAALGRAVSDPRAINVRADEGQVTLRGSVLADEYPGLLEAVCSVPGVEDVVDELSVYEYAEGGLELQGGRWRRRRFALVRGYWPPAVRVLVGATGAVAAVWGARQVFAERGHGVLGASAAASGLTLLLRSAMNVPARQLAGAARRREMDIRKTREMEAATERVVETGVPPRTARARPETQAESVAAQPR